MFDNTMLIAFFEPKAKIDPAIKARVEFLVETLTISREQIVIPTPALAEFLIKAEEVAPRYLDTLNKSRAFRIVPFDQRAAVEAAAAHRTALLAGDKKEGSDSWAKVKYDRQIVAIAVVEHASHIYSDDSDMRRLVEKNDIKVVGLQDLPDRPLDNQSSFEFPGSANEPEEPN